jgi:hypothetical protein
MATSDNVFESNITQWLDGHWPIWKVNDETVGCGGEVRPGSNAYLVPLFFGPVSNFKGIHIKGDKITHKSDKKYIFTTRKVEIDGTPCFGGFFNDANQNLYELMIDSINSSSDASVNSLFPQVDMKVEPDEEGYMWLSLPRRKSSGPGGERKYMLLDFSILGPVWTVLFIAAYQKEKGTPISNFNVTPKDLPMSEGARNDSEEEIKNMLRLDNKLIQRVVERNPNNESIQVKYGAILKYRRLKELGIDYQLVTYEDRNRLKDIDPSDPDDVAAIRAEVAAAKKAK